MRLLSPEVCCSATVINHVSGFSFSNKENSGVYIPIHWPEKKDSLFDDYAGKVIEMMRPVMENISIPKTGQNVKFDSLILMRYGLKVEGIFF